MTKKQLTKLHSVVFTSIRGLAPAQLKQVMDFVVFLQTRGQIDPTQAYFWTQKWQAMEMSAHTDKKLGRLTGNGTVTNLLKSLHQ